MQRGQKVRDYILDAKIGEGGMGEVWSAHHAVLPRQVAIKVMARQIAADPRFEDRFIKEAQAQATLQHPRILGVNDFFSEEGVYYLVMPLMTGVSLAARMERTPGPLPIAEAISVAQDILDALDYSHRKGIIHRDVKPSNIMLDNDGHAYLMDFGIALALGQTRLTRTGTSLGTPHYISPEQIRNAKGLDHRTDVYSVGCVLYEMLAGRPPFLAESEEGDTDFALKEAHMYHVPQPIRTWNAAIPTELDNAVLRALEKDPDRRYNGCGELRHALDTADRPGVATLPASAVPQTPVGGQWFYTRNQQRLGPVSEAELRRLATTGQVARTDMVWNQALPDWCRAGEIPSLFSAPTLPPSSPSQAQRHPVDFLTPQPASPASIEYANFARRLGAILIDVVCIFLLALAVGFCLGILVGISGNTWGEEMNGLANILGFLLQWYYFARFESSNQMATPGKRLLGLHVTDLEGRRISFGRATGRYFGKIISALVFGLGFLAVLWTPKRQAWHDSMAGCLVLKAP